MGCCQLPARDTLPSLQEHTRTRPPLPTAATLSCSGMAIPWLPWQIRALERGGGQGCPSAPLFVPQLGLISPCSLWFIGFRFTFRVVSRHHHRAALAVSRELLPLDSGHPFPLTFSSSSFPTVCAPQLVQAALPWAAQRADPDQVCQDAAAAPTLHFTPSVFSDSSRALCRTSSTTRALLLPTSMSPWLAKPHFPAICS